MTAILKVDSLNVKLKFPKLISQSLTSSMKLETLYGAIAELTSKAQPTVLQMDLPSVLQSQMPYKKKLSQVLLKTLLAKPDAALVRNLPTKKELIPKEKESSPLLERSLFTKNRENALLADSEKEPKDLQ